MVTDKPGHTEFSDKWFAGRSLIIVTNREPYEHTVAPDGGINCTTPTGGVTAAMDPVMQDVGGTWIAWGSGNADPEVVDDHDRVPVPPLKPKYNLKRVWLSKKDVNDFYFGYCNEGLWPLAHNLVSKVRFEQSQWRSYQRVNRKFALAVLEEAHDGDIVWIHDYHLTLAPGIIKKHKPGVTVVFFWHIPWPQYDVFRICPDHKRVLNGLLACDLVGFHIDRYCNNFRECVERAMGPARLDKPMPAVRSFPISIDVAEIDRVAASKRVKKRIDQLTKQFKLKEKLVGVGVERLDYTKGIPERLEALEILLDTNPGLHGRFTMLQLCSPSRTEIEEYKTIKHRVVELTERINNKYATPDWTPLVVFHRKVPFEHILAMYRMADVCIVSPLVDGMNLVAKEFIAAQLDKKGVLVLSQFAGAAGSIENAIICNPFERDSFAEHIHQALDMPAADKRKMIKAARREMRGYTVFDWVNVFLKSAAGIADRWSAD